MKTPVIHNQEKNHTGKGKGKQSGQEQVVAVPHRITLAPGENAQHGAQ